jgi:hypothetical protein
MTPRTESHGLRIRHVVVLLALVGWTVLFV